MSVPLPSPLPAADRAFLKVAAFLVPAAERPDWLRAWEAELWHRRHPRPGRSSSAIDLYPGALSDSLWLRTHTWQRALNGTALLCLLLLAASLFAGLLPLWTSLGGVRALEAFASAAFIPFLCEAGLVALVSFATFSRAVEYNAAHRHPSGLLPQCFQAAKVLLLLLTAFVLSHDITQPFHSAFPFTAEVVQPQIFVVLALIAMRWSFEDQERRCKHCLRSLSTPFRVGRPSWNFLDSNGTELLCRDGHGLLRIPELETSWRQSAHWIAT